MQPHPGVLTFLRLQLEELKPDVYRRDRDTKVVFGDSDMFAFCDYVLRGLCLSGELRCTKPLRVLKPVGHGFVGWGVFAQDQHSASWVVTRWIQP